MQYRYAIEFENTTGPGNTFVWATDEQTARRLFLIMYPTAQIVKIAPDGATTEGLNSIRP